MTRLVLKLAIFILILLVILWRLDVHYTKYFTTHKNVCQKPDWILNHTNQSYDFAALGNSRVYNMTDVPMIERKTGKSGINLGSTGTNYSELYLLLDQFLKNGNTIRNLAIQVDMINLDTRVGYPFKLHNHSFMQLLSDPVVYDVYKANNPIYKVWVWKYIPFMRYMEFSNRFVFYKVMKGGFECKTEPGLDTTKGASYLIGENFFKEEVHEKWVVQDFDNNYLDKIVDYARERNMNVIFYTAPIYAQYLSNPRNYDEIIHFILTKARARNIPYFDFSGRQNPMCKDVNNFYDNAHMNITGTRLFSAALADSIKTHLR